LVFIVVFEITGLFPLFDGKAVRLWAILVNGTLLFLSLVLPQSLKLLNRLWFAFGLLIHKVVNPVIMALLFF